MISNLSRCVALVVVLLVGALFSIPQNAQAQATGVVRWKTEPLAWSSGGFTRSFTAAMTDTGFVRLPGDVAWDVLHQAAGVNSMRLTFRTSAAAANADTVHYRHQVCVGGVCTFVDARNGTKAITNAATIARGADAGLVFTGMLQVNMTGVTAELPDMWTPDSRIKVQGDPNGALANLRVWLTYPTRTP